MVALSVQEPVAVNGGAAQQDAAPIKPSQQQLPKVLMLHTGGTLGMDPELGTGPDEQLAAVSISAAGTAAAAAARGLRPAKWLANVINAVPELRQLADVDLLVVCNKDSSHLGPAEWVQIARVLDEHRQAYDAFIVIHGTDTMAYTAAALSLMLDAFGKPIVMTGSQLPLALPRSDARQNLLDAMQCAVAAFTPPYVGLQEVAICFGGRLLRGNKARKVHTSSYQAFDSPGYPHLAQLGVNVAWDERMLLRCDKPYTPRFNLEPGVLRVPVVPGVDPRIAYGDLVARGVKGAVLEVFGLGNIPDLPAFGWMPWLEAQVAQGLHVAVVSQCEAGPMQPELYAAGGALHALTKQNSNGCASPTPPTTGNRRYSTGAMGAMTPECAVVKLMLALGNSDVCVHTPIAGEL